MMPAPARGRNPPPPILITHCPTVLSSTELRSGGRTSGRQRGLTRVELLSTIVKVGVVGQPNDLAYAFADICG